MYYSLEYGLFRQHFISYDATLGQFCSKDLDLVDIPIVKDASKSANMLLNLSSNCCVTSYHSERSTIQNVTTL